MSLESFVGAHPYVHIQVAGATTTEPNSATTGDAQAKPIPMAQAQAREEIWTPEKEREEKGGLWTPGSD